MDTTNTTTEGVKLTDIHGARLLHDLPRLAELYGKPMPELRSLWKENDRACSCKGWTKAQLVLAIAYQMGAPDSMAKVMDSICRELDRLRANNREQSLGLSAAKADVYTMSEQIKTLRKTNDTLEMEKSDMMQERDELRGTLRQLMKL